MTKLEAFLLFYVYLPLQKIKQFWCGANLNHCWHKDLIPNRPSSIMIPDPSCNYANNVFEVIDRKCCKCSKEKTEFKYVKTEKYKE